MRYKPGGEKSEAREETAAGINPVTDPFDIPEQPCVYGDAPWTGASHPHAATELCIRLDVGVIHSTDVSPLCRKVRETSRGTDMGRRYGQGSSIETSMMAR